MNPDMSHPSLMANLYDDPEVPAVAYIPDTEIAHNKIYALAINLKGKQLRESTIFLKEPVEEDLITYNTLQEKNGSNIIEQLKRGGSWLASHKSNAND